MTTFDGYTYQADTYCTRHGATEALRVLTGNAAIPESLSAELSPVALDLAFGQFSPANVETLAEHLLGRLAEHLGIDMLDSRTFDSGDFPKVIAHADEADTCTVCGEWLDGSDRESSALAELRDSVERETRETVTRAILDEIRESAYVAGAFGFVPSLDAIAAFVASEASMPGESVPLAFTYSGLSI